MSAPNQLIAAGRSDAPSAAPSGRSRSARPWLVLGGSLVILLAAVLLSLLVGSRALDPATVLHALLDPQPTPDHAVVWDSRVPRTLVGLAAGSALGVAGALIQGLTRNPLADPGILGVNAGAAFFVVLGAGIGGVASTAGSLLFAFAGALAATVVVYLIGTGGRRSVDPIRLTLAGVAFGAVLTGITTALTLVLPHAFDRLRAWHIGTIDVRSVEPAAVITPFVLLGIGLALVASRGLNALALGEDVAAGLGAVAWRTRLLAIVAITLLAGSATAVTGSIGFLGLVVPHLARRLCGPDQRWVVGLSVVMAPTLLLLADVLGRVVLPQELEVGVVTAFLGAPVMVALARQRRVLAL